MEEVRAPERKGGLFARLPFGGAPGSGSIERLLKKVRAYNQKADVRVIERAYALAEASHRGQIRKSGEPFIEHPLGVTEVLADLGMDTTTLVAGLLHDVVEDTTISLEEVEREFGADVAMLVDGVTKLDKVPLRTREQQQAENVRKMLIAMARDIRVLIIKLADRTHNMRTLEPLSTQKQEKKATETLEIYAPLAHRLGIYSIRWELEDLAFRTLHPRRYQEIENLVGKAEDERQSQLDEAKRSIARQLKDVKIRADVTGRPKHLYGVYEKMVLRGKEFNEIYDLLGIRILCDSVKDCYGALGAVHSMWKPVPGRFKDYIAMPKFNMYQSLHTVVIGPGGKPLEVQIRTEEMHRTAEYGIAAHWRYKEGKKGRKDEADLAWLRQIMDWQQETQDPKDFMESLRIDLYQDQIFAFTPKGDVVNLPAESTPIDFAYSVHTEVGHRMMGAKVNGKLVPLSYRLQTGDTVEVLTSKSQEAGPTRDWLQIVQSPRARNKIKQWFSRERREDAMETGREQVQREMRRQGLPLKRLTTEQTMRQAAEDLNYGDLESLLIAVGEGHVSPKSIVTRLERLVGGLDEEDAGEDVPPARPVRLGKQEAGQAVLVQGSSDVWVKLARCCTPVPGDEIVGFVTRGKGVSVHRGDCPNTRALENQQDRFIQVSWRAGKPTSFVVSIMVEALDRKKLLGDVATVLSEHQVNILSATSTVGKDRVAKFRFSFELADIAHLDSVLKAVKKVDAVFDAYRELPG